MNKRRKKIKFNIPQLAIMTAPQKVQVAEWGRGTGKSTIIAKRLIDFAMQMPRCYIAFPGDSYINMQTLTLPSTIKGLEMLGFVKDYHYTFGKRGPKRWPEPYTTPLSYKHAFHFFTGAVVIMLSQDRDTGRGLNSDGAVSDESARQDFDNLYNNVITTIRGNDDKFGKVPIHQSQLYVSSTPVTSTGKWMLEFEKLAIEKPSEYYYLIAPSYWNKNNLGARFFRQAKTQSLSETLYNAEINCIRPPSNVDGFYFGLTTDHYYTATNFNFIDKQDPHNIQLDCRADEDVNTDRPLIISLDWGIFNSLVVQQDNGKEYNVLKEFWAHNPRILDDMIREDFIPYYEPIRDKVKTIIMRYDRNGNNRRANNKTTLAQDVQRLLEQAGWRVVRLTKGLDAEHHEKYQLFNRALKGEDSRLPRIKFNKANCPNLIVSLENAEAIQNDNGSMKKDKRSERRKSVRPERATHLSDALDAGVMPMIKERLQGRKEFHDFTVH